MLRRMIVTLALVALPLAGAARAETATEALERLLRLPEVFAIMREEGIAYGDELAEDMFPGSGGAAWQAAVARAYADSRVYPIFRAEFEAALAEPGLDTDAMIAFFSSGLGARAIGLEIAARRALLDPDVEEASRLRLDEERIADTTRMQAIATFVEANDLIEANVSGGLNASYAFFKGLAEVGAAGEMTDAEILDEVWAQEVDIRADTEEWILSMLLMAYAPLKDSDLDAYIAFSRSEPGQALNRALFAGFDPAFVDISRELGREAGQVLAGQDL